MSSDGFASVTAELERLPVAAGIVDLDGTILAVNAAAGSLFGRAPGQLVGQKATSLAPGTGHVWPEIVEGARGGPHHSDITIGTRAIHYVASLRSVGERSVVMLLAIEVAVRSETLGLVVGGIAHDFNNQLVSVLAEATAAREATPDVGVRDALGRIEAAAQRMALLTKQLLSYAGKGRVVSEVFDPDELIRESIDDLTRLLRPDAKLSLSFGTAVTIRADRAQLREVIVNLAANASEAIHANGGVVKITTEAIQRKDETWWRLAVIDDGVGMAHDVLPQIFDPFFTTKQDRHGLGLSAVHGIVRRFGGRITVASEPGRGSTFVITFPTVAGIESRQRRARTASETSRSLRGLTLLVADDEPTVRATLRRLLERRGAKVVIATDGEEAERLLGEDSYVLAVFDVMMPKRTGYQLVPIARSLQPHAKVLLMSGFTGSERGASEGDEGDGFLEKPFTSKQLDEAIDALIGPLVSSR